MSKQSSIHFHLTHKRGDGPITRLPEMITGGEAAMRLIEEIAAHYVKNGCRSVKYSVGVRVYDCKDSSVSDQSFEYQKCNDAECGLTPEETEYGRWAKADRQRYLMVLKGRGLLAS